MNRQEVAEFWDNAVMDWILEGQSSPEPQTTWKPPLDRWFASYNGAGRGAVDLRHFPDPFVGNILSVTNREPKILTLGLNPGIGYDELQAPTGVWAQNILQEGFSSCTARSPEGDPKSWQRVHGGRSVFWRNLVNFARRWLKDDAANFNDIMCFEMYPWHSTGLTAGMDVPSDIVKEFIFDPLAGFQSRTIFAFGAPWFRVAEKLELKVAKPPQVLDQDMGWRGGIFELPSEQHLVVSSQQGFAGPPGIARIPKLRSFLQ